MEREAYRGAREFSVTLATWRRSLVFQDARQVANCKEALESAALRSGFTILVYCFMPDHLHLLVEGSDESDLGRFMKALKQTTSYHHKKRTGRLLWQRSYHDRVIRNERDAEAAFTYILENPVRAGWTTVMNTPFWAAPG